MTEPTNEYRIRLAECEMEESRIRPGDLYVHHKCRLTYPDVTVYAVECLAVREDDFTPCVVYRSIADGATWCRPLAEFQGTVEEEGRTLPRFAFVGRVEE